MRDIATDGEVDELALVDSLAVDLGLRPTETHRPQRVEHDDGRHRLSGLRWGRGEARVVLLHGGSLNAHAWDAMLLHHRELDGLALDLPGHGRSSWFDDPVYLPADLAVAVAPVIEAMTTAPVAVVGHSLGGLTALALAASRPELVERLVLVDATPGSTPERSQELVDFVSSRDFGDFEELLDHAASFKPHRDRDSLRRSLLLNARRRVDGRWTWRHDGRARSGVDRWTRVFEELPKGWDAAAVVTCPTLLVRGERSRIVLPSDIDRYRALMADLRVVEIAGAGHNIHGDQPARLGVEILRFLRDPDPHLEPTTHPFCGSATARAAAPTVLPQRSQSSRQLGGHEGNRV